MNKSSHTPFHVCSVFLFFFYYYVLFYSISLLFTHTHIYKHNKGFRNGVFIYDTLKGTSHESRNIPNIIINNVFLGSLNRFEFFLNRFV